MYKVGSAQSKQGLLRVEQLCKFETVQCKEAFNAVRVGTHKSNCTRYLLSMECTYVRRLDVHGVHTSWSLRGRLVTIIDSPLFQREDNRSRSHQVVLKRHQNSQQVRGRQKRRHTPLPSRKYGHVRCQAKFCGDFYEYKIMSWRNDDLSNEINWNE